MADGIYDLDLNINFSKNAEKELETNLENLVKEGMSGGMSESFIILQKEAKKFKSTFKGIQILENNQKYVEQMREVEKLFKRNYDNLTKQEKDYHQQIMKNAREKLNQNAKVTAKARK